jgi:hypothetical protein
MRIRILGFGVAAAVGCSGLLAQAVAPSGSEPMAGVIANGARLTGASAFASYDSLVPETISFGGVGVRLRGDVSVGGSVTGAIGWSRGRSWFSMSYTPSYIARVRDSAWNTSQHVFSMSWRRRTTEKWTTNFSATGALGSVTNLLFTPTNLSRLAGAGGSAEDLGSAALGGSSNNAGLDAAAGQATALESPAGAAIYGSRVLSASAGGSLVYAYSGRFNLRFRADASRAQGLKPPNSTGSQAAALIAHTESGGAGLGFSYALSPRTQIGMDAGTERIRSRAQDSYRSTGSLTLGRRMTMRTFAEVHGGVGVITPVRQAGSLPTGAQYQAGGQIGYRAFANTFLANVERAAGDSYGLGASASVSANLAWMWRRPGSSWWLSIDAGQQRLSGQFPNLASRSINSWRGTAGIGRRLGGHLAILTQYAYLSDSGVGAGLARVPPQHVGRITFIWLANENAVQ